MSGIHDLLVKVIGLGIFIAGLTFLAGGLSGESHEAAAPIEITASTPAAAEPQEDDSGPGAFQKAFVVAAGLLILASAAGFVMYKGWAFILVSIGLLVGFLVTFIRFLLAFDHPDQPIVTAALPLLACIALIAFLGRWSVERHFRPNAGH